MAEEGFTIPLEGDAEPFRTAVAELRGTLARTTRQMSRSNKSGRREVAQLGRGWRTMGAAARGAMRLARAGLKGIVVSARLAGRAVKGIFARIGGGLKALIPGRLVALLSVAGVVGTVGAAVLGLKRALNVGGALSDLSAQTGMAVEELVVLQQAFEDNGVSAEKVGALINKMQRTIVEATQGLTTYQRAFESVGLAAEDLLQMTPAEQFEQISDALARMEDPTARAAAALQIFGRSGGELVTLFRDGGAMDKARVTIGSQAKVLEENARLFDRVSDLLSSAGKKLQGFFVGAAEKIAPALRSVLEEINKIDLVGMGRKFGRLLLLPIAAFKNGRLGELFKSGLRFGIASALDLLFRGLRGAVAFLAKALPPIFGALFNKLTDPQFWAGVKDLFVAAGDALAAEIKSAFGKGNQAQADAQFLRDAAKIGLASAEMNFREAGGGVDMAKVLGDALVDGAVAAAAAAGGPASEGVKAARAALVGMNEELAATVRKLAAMPADLKAQGKLAVVPGEDDGAGPAGGRGPSLARVVSSLARIGGGGGGFTLEPMVAEARRQTTVLKRIEKNTREGGKVVATYA